jgi:fatty acid desaturase
MSIATYDRDIVVRHQETEKEVMERAAARSINPRAEMYYRLPGFLQPFLTWLTARPAPGETPKSHSSHYHVVTAFATLVAGVVFSLAALELGGLWLIALPFLMIISASGMGKLQAVVFHHCAHGTVFQERSTNRRVGETISILLLMKHFDVYQHEHMLHHSPNKLLTHEDEFTQFVMNLAGLRPGLPKEVLWRRVLISFVSPFFHLRFLLARVSSCLLSHSTVHNLIGWAAWGWLFYGVWLTGTWTELVVVWLFPVVVLLQVGTALRTLCEHRFPEQEVIDARGKTFVCLATAGVFPGAPVPEQPARTPGGLATWAGWWAAMLTVHLFARVFVLVGDAPCHDFHHRRPASRRWTDYIHARQKDADSGCPTYPLGYIETWGLFKAIDENLASLSTAARI